MEQIGKIEMFLNESQDQLTLSVSEYKNGDEHLNSPIRLGWGDVVETSINYHIAGGKIILGAIGTLSVRFGVIKAAKPTLAGRIRAAWRILWI